jgi:acetyltransferase-like isoleucine patch superfamily enzyme
MTEENDKLKQRAESLKRLLDAPSRADDHPPLMEKIINNFPIRTSFIYRALMRMAGIKVGKGVKFMGKARVKLRGEPKNIIIGDYVVLGKNVDLRNRENGKIILNERVYLDDNVRIVAAREGKVVIDVGTELGSDTVINSGGNTTIGKFCMIAGNVQIHAQNHDHSKGKYIKEQSYEYGKVTIGSDVWIGCYSSVLVNTAIGEGAVIGANSMAKGKIPAFSICAGSPAKIIRYRE